MLTSAKCVLARFKGVEMKLIVRYEHWGGVRTVWKTSYDMFIHFGMHENEK